MKPSHRIAYIRDLPDGTRDLVGDIIDVDVDELEDILPSPVEAGLKRKVWKIGDKASEVVYRKQGWFPGP